MMRYLAIIALLFIGCRTTNLTGQHNPNSFSIVVRYYEQPAENNVLQVLNQKTVLIRYDVRHPTIYTSEIEATCRKLKGTSTDALWEELKQTAGVSNVVFNPR